MVLGDMVWEAGGNSHLLSAKTWKLGLGIGGLKSENFYEVLNCRIVKNLKRL